ncbi:hypothetical protein MA16_Dca012482 [Dendrobium catenatum]|uniref:Uncharacterized protein n=1 Tax=Dendrobium catenatum TaxID=906689 RepID=A0A2I0XD48_9ASPA|nr:hypothetical protein MA16_Dca012482 [Dendrobium catenatum]
MQEKRAKGLCFRCDEKYTPWHKCRDRTIQVLIVCDDDETEGGESMGEKEMEDKLHLDVIEISLNSMVGFPQNHTMKVKGKIADMEVVVFIDSGATHNFISNQVVDQLGVTMVDTRYNVVMMSTWKEEMGQGICRGVVLTIQGVQVRGILFHYSYGALMSPWG